jgi:hypothetical protein
VDPTDGLARVVSSGGNSVGVWKLQTSPKAKLTHVAYAGIVSGVPNPGFFTSVSSNGNANPIIWVLSRPRSQELDNIWLYAFNPEPGGKMAQLFKHTAGFWPNQGGDSNLVPVVANGKVFVGTNQELRIFGLTTPTKTQQSKGK